MEVFFLLAGFLLGAAAVAVGGILAPVVKARNGRDGKRAEGEAEAETAPFPEEDEEVPQYIKRQYENFMSYDGTGRGQKQLGDL